MEKQRINVYTCKDGHRTITRDAYDGITPFIIKCTHKGCKKPAQSGFYKIDQKTEPTHEFYMPSDYAGLKSEEISRIRNGGLLMRKI